MAPLRLQGRLEWARKPPEVVVGDGDWELRQGEKMGDGRVWCGHHVPVFPNVKNAI